METGEFTNSRHPLYCDKINGCESTGVTKCLDILPRLDYTRCPVRKLIKEQERHLALLDRCGR